MYEPKKVLCGESIVGAKDVTAKRDSCRSLNKNLVKHKQQNGLWVNREHHVGVTFSLVASYPILAVASQQKYDMLYRVPTIGRKIALKQLLGWILFV